MSDVEKYMERSYDALEASRILLQNDKFNAAISQAYYAMYYAAKALLSARHLYPKTHKGVVAKLGLEFVNKGYLEEVYGKALAKVFGLREKVDYDIYYNASREEAISAISEAEKFVERINSVLEELKKEEDRF